VTAVTVGHDRLNRPHRDVQLQARLLLQVTDYAEEVLRLRIAAPPEHADQALGRRIPRCAQLLEADGRTGTSVRYARDDDFVVVTNLTALRARVILARDRLG
jgi:hypothetical protein